MLCLKVLKNLQCAICFNMIVKIMGASSLCGLRVGILFHWAARVSGIYMCDMSGDDCQDYEALYWACFINIMVGKLHLWCKAILLFCWIIGLFSENSFHIYSLLHDRLSLGKKVIFVTDDFFFCFRWWFYGWCPLWIYPTRTTGRWKTFNFYDGLLSKQVSFLFLWASCMWLTMIVY